MLNLVIKSSPSDCYSREVIIDGHFVSQDSICVTEVTSGTHQVEIEMTGCQRLRKTVNINKSDTLEFYLSPNNIDYEKAYGKNISACLKLVRKLNNSGTYNNKENEKESIYWGDKACQYLYESKDDILKETWYDEQYEWEHLISIYLRSPGGIDKAHKLVDRISVSDIVKMYSLANFIASMYYNLKDYNSAIKWYQRYAKSVSSDITILSENYRRIGECYYNLKDYNKAIEYGKKAEQVYDGYVWSKSLLGDSYFNLGVKSSAIHWYREAMKCCQNDNNDYGIHILLSKARELGIFNEVTNGILNM
jgi:tetratricopeptide (TPR) repeat protein